MEGARNNHGCLFSTSLQTMMVHVTIQNWELRAQQKSNLLQAGTTDGMTAGIAVGVGNLDLRSLLHGISSNVVASDVHSPWQHAAKLQMLTSLPVALACMLAPLLYVRTVPAVFWGYCCSSTDCWTGTSIQPSLLRS